jgi:hypothetical protein
MSGRHNCRSTHSVAAATEAMTATMARTLNCILKVGGLFGVGEAGRLVKGVGGVVEESGVRER